MLHVFFCNFLRSSGLNRAHSDMDEKISSPCSSQRTKLSLIVKTDDVTSGRGGGRWIRTGGYGWFKGEWV